MEDAQEKTSSPLPSTPEDVRELREQYWALRKQMVTLLVLVIVVSGALNMFLLRQFTYARNDLANVQRQTAQIKEAYNREAPIMQDFVRKLAEYGKSHPDFAPIVKKYNLHAPTPTGAQPPATVIPPTATPPVPATKP